MGYPQGIDGVEPADLGVDVQCNAVVGDPLSCRNADAGNFGPANPDARSAHPYFRLKPVLTEEIGDDVQQVMEIEVKVLFNEPDDGIGHELAGSVESRHSATVHVKDGGASSPERFFAHSQFPGAPAPPDGHYGRVFEQHQPVW